MPGFPKRHSNATEKEIADRLEGNGKVFVTQWTELCPHLSTKIT